MDIPIAKYVGKDIIELSCTELDQMAKECKLAFKRLNARDQAEMKPIVDAIINNVTLEINRRMVCYAGHA